MPDPVETARILDIMGNRNRRRIIELLRQKPCFVTEISERLMISPKAVIDHLQLMEREEILGCHLDERRRKYYYLARDIRIQVDFSVINAVHDTRSEEVREKLASSLTRLRRMVRAREELVSSLSQLDDAIDIQIRGIQTGYRNGGLEDREAAIAIALAHYDLSREELHEVTGIPLRELEGVLARMTQKNFIENERDKYRLRGIHAT